MRTLTNRFNLPQPFVDAVSFDEYTKGDAQYSTTGLLKPARITALLRKHRDDIREDAVDLVWRLSGSAKHVVLERAAKSNPDKYLIEKRLFMDVAGYRISGQLDLYDKASMTLYDYKESSVWKVLKGDTKEWESQGNINALLCRRNGIEVKALINIAILKDFKQRDAQLKDRYPECAVRSCRLGIWPEEETINFIEQRIAAHEAAKTKLPMCSLEERWQDEPKFAVMQPGKARAVKLYDTEEQAEAAAGQDQWVEPREYEPRRCLYYCPVSAYCDFARDYISEHKHI